MAAVLFNEQRIKLVAETGNALLAAELARVHSPDVMIIDPYLPRITDGRSVLCEIRTIAPTVRLLCFSSSANINDIEEMMASGAAGYVAKRNALKEIVHAVFKVAQGEECYLCPIATRMLLKKNRGCETVTQFEKLTRREQEIFKALACGKDTGTISSLFHISMDTVATHRRNIFKKLGLNSIPNLIWFAIEHDIVNVYNFDHISVR